MTEEAQINDQGTDKTPEPVNPVKETAPVETNETVPVQNNIPATEVPADKNKQKEVEEEVSKSYPKLSERELKDKINQLRQRLDQNERELKTIFRDISLNNEGGQDLKAKRDGLNARVKELSPKAADLRKKRDETNSKIAELKAMRENLRDKGKEFNDKIGDLKKTRDELNTTARGRLETLEKAYTDELNIFLNADIPLEHELNVYARLLELSQRLEATKKANAVHGEITVEYDRAKVIYTDLDSLHTQVQTLAQESQKYHEEMIKIYNEIDTLRKEADSYHSQLSEKFKNISPLKKKISALKTEMPKLRDELGVYLEQMKGYQLARDEQKNEGKREQAKEKLNKKGRLSLEEFRILVESKDIKL